MIEIYTLTDGKTTKIDAAPERPQGRRFDVVWDIETTQNDNAGLLCPPFNESDVKTGNWSKDPAKFKDRMEERRMEHYREHMDKASLNAKYGRVGIFTFSLVLDGEYNPPIALVAWDQVSEIEILDYASLMFETLKVVGGESYGFNIHGFDLRFLVQRMFLNKIKTPAWVYLYRKGGRSSWSDRHVDIEDVINLPIRSRTDLVGDNKLDDWLQAMFGTKKLISGKDVPGLIRNRSMLAVDYALDEMKQLCQMVKRLKEADLM